jgi:dolichol-phosphate mannosyltransferase
MSSAASGAKHAPIEKISSERSLKVSVVLPTLNEADNIVPLIEEIRKAVPNVHEIIVVDDDSKDGTADLVEAHAKKKGPGAVRIERRLTDHGLTKSLWHGITKCTGDVVVWMDCDFSMPPDVIPSLLRCIAEGYHIAVGSRFVPGGSFKRNTEGTQDSWLAVVLSRMMNYAVQFALDHSFKDYTSGFAAVRKNVFLDVAFRGDYGEYFIDFIYRALHRGYTVIEIPYVCVPRRAGESKTGQNIFQFMKRGTGYLQTAARLRWESFFTQRAADRALQIPAETPSTLAPLSVKPMLREHVPFVAGLHHQVLRQTLNSRLGIPFLEALYTAILQDPGACGWVAIREDRLAGFLTASEDLHATERRLSRAVSLREKLSAGVRVLSSLHDMRDLFRHKLLAKYVRVRFGRPYSTILTLGVSPLARGQGVAQSLVEEADAYFAMNGIRHYYVDTLEDNAAAQAFYRQSGFDSVGAFLGNHLFRKTTKPVPRAS